MLDISIIFWIWFAFVLVKPIKFTLINTGLDKVID